MKNIAFILGPVLLLFLLITCEHQDVNDTVDILKFEKVIPGGCNLEPTGLKSVGIDEKDTVYYTVHKDTLRFFAGFNYICCSDFSTTAVLSNDSITMTIQDECPSPGYTCGCRCICYYTFDFVFFSSSEKEYFYKVILKDPREDLPAIIGKGKISLMGKPDGN